MTPSSPARAPTASQDAPYGEPFLPDYVFPADLAIVFGMTSWQRPLARAIELHRGGMARKLLFTGGFNERIGAAEAVEMANAAAASGIDPADIIVEPLATNTAENVFNARRCVERSIGLDGLHSVLLVAIHFHMRRVRAIFAETFPSHIRVGTASYPSIHYTSDNWVASARGRQDVEAESRKLAAYFKSDQWRTVSASKE